VKRTEATYIAHCGPEEEYACDLGSVEYECPACGALKTDYGNLWWNRDEIHGGLRFPFKCGKCNADLVIYWDDEEMEYFVEECVSREFSQWERS
jgi:hypothetical protein